MSLIPNLDWVPSPGGGGDVQGSLAPPAAPASQRRGTWQAPTSAPLSFGRTTPLSEDQLFAWMSDPNMSLADMLVQGQLSPANQIATSRGSSVYAIPFAGADTKVPGQQGTTVTLQALLGSLGRLTRDQMMRLQQQMSEAGYYPSADSTGQPTKVQWGVADGATRKAYQNMITDAIRNPSQTLDELLSDRAGQSFKDVTNTRKTSRDAQVADLLSQAQNQLTSSGDLARIAQTAAKETIGQSLTPEELNAFVSSFHAKETEHVTGLINARLAKVGSTGNGATDAQADQFVNAVMAEAGDKTRGAGLNALGMTLGEWSKYADKAGLGPNTPDTPENERLVAKEIALNFAEQYKGSWSDVATAWFAGPGKHLPALASKIDNPYPAGSLQAANYEPPAPTSIRDLADKITQTMRSGVSGAVGANGQVTAGDLNLTEGVSDPTTAALDAIKQAHPVEYAGQVVANRAKEFFDFLSSSTPKVAQN